MSIKGLLMTFVVIAVSVAVIFRVSAVRNIVVGS